MTGGHRPATAGRPPAEVVPLPTTANQPPAEVVPLPTTATRPRRNAPRAEPWAELHVHSAFSFLDGTSEPEELVAEAARLGVETLALTDHDGLYGAVRLDAAARTAGLRTVFGAELNLRERRAEPGRVQQAPARNTHPRNTQPQDTPAEHLLVLARGPDGYRRLSAAIGAAQLAGPGKGRPAYEFDRLADAHGGQWAVLTGCRNGRVRRALEGAGPDAALRELRLLSEAFGPKNVFVELIDHRLPGDDARNDALAALAARAGLAVVASNNVHHPSPAQGRLAQGLAALRARKTLQEAAGWTRAAGTAHLRSGAEMAARLGRFPGVQRATAELGRACSFEFASLDRPLPGFPVPPGHTQMSQLRALTQAGAATRFEPGNRQAEQQLTKELGVIEELGLAGYFLIVHDLVEFCRRSDIWCQGRGSAANSAVCYALGITAVDPIDYRLLFERFLSMERDGPPDIDLDIEHRRREEVIQYVYRRYGREHAAQVANVITYRPRLALRDAARVLGYPMDQVNAFSRQADFRSAPGPDAVIPADVLELSGQLESLPRHLGIHSGGMVLTAQPISEICPTEWARMPGRSVLQWDKESTAGAKLVKIDLLGLGMLSALHDACDLVAEHHGKRYDLDSIPQKDPAVYEMLCRADTVGVFQVESRAQMSTLPRLKPREFYDLVVEVALIRPRPVLFRQTPCPTQVVSRWRATALGCARPCRALSVSRSEASGTLPGWPRSHCGAVADQQPELGPESGKSGTPGGGAGRKTCASTCRTSPRVRTVSPTPTSAWRRGAARGSSTRSSGGIGTGWTGPTA